VLLARLDTGAASEFHRRMGAAPPHPPLPQREALLEALLRRLLEADQREATHVVDTALTLGWTVDDVRLSLITPALREVGARWERGTIGVAEEHLASSVSEWLLYALAGRAPRRRRTGLRAVVGCTQDELHSLGARIVGHMLVERGWSVLFIGASTPPEAWAEVVEARRPDVAVLSTTTQARLEPVARTLAAIRARRPGCRTVVGGQAYWSLSGPPPGIDADLVALDPQALAEELQPA
jgi:methanogenic corrinoid protein MtbC1